MARSRQPGRRSDPDLERARRALETGDAAGAVRMYRSIVGARPRVPEAHAGLGVAARMVGRLGEAATHLRRSVELDGSNAVVQHLLGTTLRDLGELDGALAALTKACWLDRSNADYHADEAGVLDRLNRVEEARRAIERALAADPDHGRARVIGAMLELRTGAPDEETMRGWVAAFGPVASSSRDALTRSLAWEAIGAIRDKLGDTAEAFEAFGRCNDLERARQHSFTGRDREAYLRSIEQFTAMLTPERAAAWRDEKPDDGVPAPALLVGFPRSGTTMTERALDAHPGIVSIEEKPTFNQVKDEMVRLLGEEARGRPFDETLDSLTADQLVALRRHYWEVAAEHAGGPIPEGTVLLDKLPIRLVNLAWVNRVFPDARVLVAIRDPRDVCLSCFRQRFTLNPPMSFFLDINDTAKLYAGLMGAWVSSRERYSLAWREFRYEDAVSDFEGVMRELVEFLGASWDDAVLSFHERRVERGSLTPSYHAVRQRVHTGAVGRYTRYAAQLAPIEPVLAPFIDAFGYER